MKRRFPLLGASVNERLGDEGVDFVVTESHLGKVVSDKIDFSSVSSMQGALDVALGILNRKRTLSDDLLGQIFILKQTDVSNEYHVLLYVTHLITDGMGNTTLLRTLLDTLSSSVGSPIPDLEERLAMVWGIDNLKTETDVTVPWM